MKKELEQIELLLNKIKDSKSELVELSIQAEHPFEIGKSYLIRTVTLYYTGRVKAIKGKFIQLEKAAWIPDTGRWQEATTSGTFKEVEPFDGNPWINTDATVDFQEIAFSLPDKQK